MTAERPTAASTGGPGLVGSAHQSDENAKTYLDHLDKLVDTDPLALRDEAYMLVGLVRMLHRQVTKGGPSNIAHPGITEKYTTPTQASTLRAVLADRDPVSSWASDQ